jgi:hypothetical protein
MNPFTKCEELASILNCGLISFSFFDCVVDEKTTLEIATYLRKRAQTILKNNSMYSSSKRRPTEKAKHCSY